MVRFSALRSPRAVPRAPIRWPQGGHLGKGPIRDLLAPLFSIRPSCIVSESRCCLVRAGVRLRPFRRPHASHAEERGDRRQMSDTLLYV